MLNSATTERNSNSVYFFPNFQISHFLSLISACLSHTNWDKKSFKKISSDLHFELKKVLPVVWFHPESLLHFWSIRDSNAAFDCAFRIRKDPTSESEKAVDLRTPPRKLRLDPSRNCGMEGCHSILAPHTVRGKETSSSTFTVTCS